MLNIRGAFVVVGPGKQPLPVLLGETQLMRFEDRAQIVGLDKAVPYTFGAGYVNAIPCTTACMEFIALNYVGPDAEQIKAICARIALGKPLGGDAPPDGGGSKDRMPKPKPAPKGPSQAEAMRKLNTSEIQS